MTTPILELLESRIAPASLIGTHTMQYTDVDGDIVTATVSKGDLSAGMFIFLSAGVGEQLNAVTLTDPQFAGANLTISVLPQITGPIGDGHVDVGAINATGNDLGKVTVGGGLVWIEAGNNLTPQKGLTSLSVGSLGTLDPTSFGLIDRISYVSGKVGLLDVQGDMSGSFVVSGGTAAGIAKIQIGGSLLAGAGTATGWIETSGDIGTATIGGHIDGRFADADAEAGIFSGTKIGKVMVTGSIFAGAENSNGGVYATTGIGSVNVGGSLGRDLGGAIEAGDFSGSIITDVGKLGKVSIGTYVAGGNGNYSGSIKGWDGIDSVTIGGSLLGGTAQDSGTIQAGGTDISGTHAANISKVFVTGNVEGSIGKRSGSILAWGGNMQSVWVGGSIIAGNVGTGGDFNALIYASLKLGKAEVVGDLVGGTGAYGGRIATEHGDLGTVIIGGDVKGGTGWKSATIEGGIDLKSLSIGGELKGGDGMDSANIFATESIGNVFIGENLTGGNGHFSGVIGTHSPALITDPDVFTGKIGKITIGGTITGGAGDYSGSIQAENSVSSVSLTGNLSGAAGDNSGSLFVHTGSLGAVTVGGDVQGGSGFNSGIIWGNSALGATSIGGNLTGGTADQSGIVISFGSGKSLSIGGSITGSDKSYTGYVQFNGSVSSIAIGTGIVGGSLVGGDASSSGAIQVGGQLGSLSIHGSILGGDNTNGNTGRTGSVVAAGIGTVEITGDIKSGTLVDNTKTLVDSGAIRSLSNLGKLTVGGSLLGNADVPVLITAAVKYAPINNNVVIGSVSVENDVTHALILAGTGNNATPNWVNPYARISSVFVGGDWTASSISAAGVPGTSGYGIGDTLSPNQVAPTLPSGNFSKITKIVIEGIIAAGDPGDQYGFVSQNFGSVTIGGVPQIIPAAGSTTNLTVDGLMTIHRIT